MDFQRIVDDVRSFVLSNDQRLTPSLAQLAEEYAHVCREANQRLRRCEEYLKQGMRSEAVQLAEAQPALLDVVQVIDFPERLAWDELAAMYGLPPAPRLLMESAKALNRAYSEVQPLDKLLRCHRLLALSGASLGERLRILRQIASRDTMNPIWRDDIRAFETTRFQQFPGEVDSALKRDDFASAIDLIRELETEPWQQTPPSGLLPMARGKARDYVGTKLFQAYKQQNEASARSLRDWWNYLGQQAGATVVAENHEVGNALRWLAQIDQKKADHVSIQERMKALEDALDEDASLEDIEDLHDDLRTRGFGLPAALESRYQARRRTLAGRAGHARRERIILAVVIGTCFLVLGMLFLCLSFRRYA